MNTIPQAQAAHFCRLFICDETGIYPLGYHARRILTPNDSLTAEQQFTSFVFYQDNWQALRLFPHQGTDGKVVWYAPSEKLPASLGSEHQKYIQEVFPRLVSEAEAGHWETVDAYIDRMIQYQCTFAVTQKESTPTIAMMAGVLVFFAYIFLIALFPKLTWRRLRYGSRG
jgi:hypothetical protein